jgi:hypothetical protein
MPTKTEYKKLFKMLSWKELINEYAWYAERFNNLAIAIKSSIDGTFDGTRTNIDTYYIKEKLSMAEQHEK